MPPKIIKHLLPESHYNERLDKTTGQPIKVDMLVLHCSSETPAEMIRVLEDRGLSTHYIVTKDGRIIQCVDESKRAWHAGRGEWKGIREINGHSVGIEIENPTYGHSTAYPEVQIQAVEQLCQSIIDRYHIQPHNVFGHSDMAPTRKADPGRLFPWEKLAESGIGLWPNQSVELEEGDTVEKLLQEIGYPTKALNIVAEDTPDVIERKQKIALNAALYAFRRHYMPQTIADNEMPQKNQQDYLYDIEPDLPMVLDCQPLPDEKTMKCLKNVAFAYKISREQIGYKKMLKNTKDNSI